MTPNSLRSAEHTDDVVDRGFSRSVLMTTDGLVVTREAALTEAVAALIASLTDDCRPTPLDLLEAVTVPLDLLELTRRPPVGRTVGRPERDRLPLAV